jgi:hypothetical protein
VNLASKYTYAGTGYANTQAVTWIGNGTATTTTYTNDNNGNVIRNACSDACDKIAVRINEGEAITAFQILKRHRLDQRRLAGSGLANDIDVQKTVFVLDAEDAIVVAKRSACLSHVNIFI